MKYHKYKQRKKSGMKQKILRLIYFIWKEILLRYLFCYFVAVVSFVVVLLYEIKGPWDSWLVSLSASMFSIPVVFVVYNLYSDALDRKTQKKISDKLRMGISNLFVRYLYFTEYFYYAIEDDFPGDGESLNQCMNYSEDKIFNLVSANVFSGVFLFSEFDSFDENIYEMINDAIVAKYIKREEIAILFEFMESYRDLKKIFKMITKDDYICCGYYDDLDIIESEHVKNANGRTFYDVRWKKEDNRYVSFFSAMYPIFEEDKLCLKIKLSGNKAKEVSRAILKTYQCIKKWLSTHGETEILYDNSVAVNGRLYVDYDLILNQFMTNNISINSKF